MDKVIIKAQELKEELYNEPLIMEYLRVKEIFENNEELEKMRRNIARLSINKNSEEYINKKKEYDHHPLVSNYYQLKEDVMDLLSEISKIVN